ncbi:MAG: MarR family winged helix-turn-helix transcriptional regulator, partial [Polyangiaceae bacterium]
MHVIAFNMKRTHHTMLAILRPIAARNHLTPARFDLLYALRAEHGSTPFQCYIAKRLGVCRTTVCKMVRAMRIAGFLEQEVHTWDQRLRRIRMTRYGKRCFNQVLKALRRGEVGRTIFSVLASGRNGEPSREMALFDVGVRARDLAVGLGSRVQLYDELLHPSDVRKRRALRFHKFIGPLPPDSSNGEIADVSESDLASALDDHLDRYTLRAVLEA